MANVTCKDLHGLKALVLAAGKGTRLRPLTNTIAKPLIPVANKPIIFHVIEQIRAAALADIGIVVSPENEEQMRCAIGDGSRWGVRVTYVVQCEQKGISHAVKTARGFLGDSPFLLFLGDNLLKLDLSEFIKGFTQTPCPDGLILLKEVTETQRFGIAELNERGEVFRIEEKPKHARSNLAVIGLYLFTPAVHEVIDRLKPSWRGEYEITDAIQGLIDAGRTVRSQVLKEWWLDTGTLVDLLEANRTMLDEYARYEVRGSVDDASQIIGRAEIGAGTIIRNSVIRGPVSIGENCRLTDCSIGPFVSLGAGTAVEGTEIQESLVLEGCLFGGAGRLMDSIVANGSSVVRPEKRPAANVLRLSEGSLVDFAASNQWLAATKER